MYSSHDESIKHRISVSSRLSKQDQQGEIHKLHQTECVSH